MPPIIKYKGYTITGHRRDLFTISKDGEIISHHTRLEYAKSRIDSIMKKNPAADAVPKLAESIDNSGLTFRDIQEPSRDSDD